MQENRNQINEIVKMRNKRKRDISPDDADDDKIFIPPIEKIYIPLDDDLGNPPGK